MRMLSGRRLLLAAIVLAVGAAGIAGAAGPSDGPAPSGAVARLAAVPSDAVAAVGEIVSYHVVSGSAESPLWWRRADMTPEEAVALLTGRDDGREGQRPAWADVSPSPAGPRDD
ncbi:MAG: hypothetical protein QMC79_06805, partial [Anaerosomatales bacterium]|nr:hypothetical protein [Anaerosomatales bacterium]